jgi:hypothetical protein
MLKIVAILALVANFTLALHGWASAAPPDPCNFYGDDYPTGPI